MSALVDALGPQGPALLAGLTAFLAVVCVYRALLVRNPMEKRAQALSKRRTDLSTRAAAPKSHGLRQQLLNAGAMQGVAGYLKRVKAEQSEEIRLKLARAGIRGPDAVTLYLISRLGMPLVIAAFAALFFFGLGALELGRTGNAIATLASAGVGFFLPDLYLKNTQTKRQQAMQKGLPDALDLLVICTEAGLSLDSAFARVAKETGPACPELAEEFTLTSIELGFLPDRKKALENLYQRTDLTGLKGVVGSLIQTEKYGTPLSQALRVLSKEFRDERMMRAEEKAARLPALMTVPLILFILPPLFVILLGPAILRTIDGLSNL